MPVKRGLARAHAWDITFLTGVTSVMAAFHLVHFGLPQINPDETSFFILNLSLISEAGSEWYEFGRTGLYLGPFPVQFSPYIGGLGAYFSAPFSYALGPSVEAVRAYNMFVAIAIQLALYVTAREMFSRRAAMVSASAFTFFPLVVFYSRQSIMYDWIILAVATLMLYFGTKFVRGGSAWNLGAAVLSASVIVWAYLSSLWFVLGVMVALPICVYSYRSRGRPITKKLMIIFAAFVVLGVIPFLVSYATNPWSLIGFMLDTIVAIGSDQPTSYQHSSTDNSDIYGNLLTRANHTYLLLTMPGMGFWANTSHNSWNPYDATFLVLFVAGIAAALVEILRRGPYRTKMSGLLVVLAVTFAASAFTVTSLNPPQLGIMLPFMLLLIGCGMDRLAQRFVGACKTARYGVRQQHVLLLVMGVVVASQIPHINDGLAVLGNDPAYGYPEASKELAAHMRENGLVPVVMDWFTHKPLFLLLEGEFIPIKAIGEFERNEFTQSVRDNMHTAESAGLVRDDLLFVIYAYPEMLDCTKDLTGILYSNQCAQAYFVESAAERNDLDVVVKDFNLPNGVPYYRTLQFEERG